MILFTVPKMKRKVTMLMTRVFQSGHSQAVRIPKALQYDRLDLELEIERYGDELRIRPMRRTLTHLTKKFRAFLKDFMSKGRGKELEGEREIL